MSPTNGSETQDTHLVLVRHGQSLYNRDGEAAGADSGLTELGWRQAQAVAEWLAHRYRPAALIASNLARAQQTADVIAHRLKLPIVTSEGLAEAEAPYWEELPQPQADPLAAWETNWHPAAARAPFYVAFRARLRAALAQILADFAGQTVIVVSHGGSIGTILRSLFGGHNLKVFTENTGITQLTFHEGHWQLVCHNLTQHLAGLQPNGAGAEALSAAATASTDSPGPGGSSSPSYTAIIQHFQRVANAAPTNLTYPTERDLAALLRLAAPQPTDRVLDAGTGAGSVALAFASFAANVTAVDLSPAMLERAETHRAARQITNVHLRLGEVSTLSLPEHGFEIVLCHDLLHYAPEPEGLLVRLRMLLAPGGRLVLDDIRGSDDPVKRATQNAIEVRRDPVTAQIYSAGEIEQLLEDAGFRIERIERYGAQRELEEWLAHAAADETTRTAVRSMLEAGLEADSAGLNVRRQRDDQIIFTQARIRALATPGRSPI